MTHSIIGLHQWFDSAPGRYLLAWEQSQFDETVADIFGYHGLQIGMPWLDGLRTNRIQHQWLALAPSDRSMVEQHPGARPVALYMESAALPFEDASLDLVLLPHTLELSADPHAAVREVHRVLVPEGKVVIAGLSPWSLWGMRQMRAHVYRKAGFGSLYLPDVGEFIAHRRLRDWLQLLGFEVELIRMGCYRPAVRSEAWLQRFAWMDAVGPRCWPIGGAAYFVVATKRVLGMRLLEPAWRGKRQHVGARAQGKVPVSSVTHHP